ncbi:hypothetical protein NA57DRAFT_24353, partial [Rhizodiscina lignyota]
LPSDPADAESLSEVITVAFGAFGRYYLCWRNRAGQYRQSHSKLPPELKAWLFPPTGETRDFASLQVLFGHGDDFFASDCNGRISYERSGESSGNNDTDNSPRSSRSTDP